jgi:hypothetical protein
MVVSELLDGRWAGNLLNLIDSVRILYDSFDDKQLEKIQDLFNYFVAKIPKLLSSVSLTINFHSLMHLPYYAKIWGSMSNWHSFPFERLNGFLKKKIHGTRYQLDQMVWHSQLNALCQELSLLPNLR